jgi:hypothetical protein
MGLGASVVASRDVNSPLNAHESVRDDHSERQAHLTPGAEGLLSPVNNTNDSEVEDKSFTNQIPPSASNNDISSAAPDDVESHQARSPATDQNGFVFQTGQGVRTPVSSVFPIPGLFSA